MRVKAFPLMSIGYDRSLAESLQLLKGGIDRLNVIEHFDGDNEVVAPLGVEVFQCCAMKAGSRYTHFCTLDGCRAYIDPNHFWSKTSQVLSKDAFAATDIQNRGTRSHLADSLYQCQIPLHSKRGVLKSPRISCSTI